MKNVPNRIYLNLGEMTDAEIQETDFKEVDEVTWSEDDIQGRNIAYVREERESKPYDMIIEGERGNYEMNECKKSSIMPSLEENMEMLAEFIGGIKSITIKFK